jgi:SulP family sulfate permease
VTKALNVLLHPSEINPASLACGVGALAVLALLGRGKLAVLGSLVALVVPTVVVLLTGTDSVRTVSDVGAIPSGFPMPVLPSFSALSPSVIAGAASVAVIVLVQGAGVAEAAPNPDGTRSVPRKDFLAQGIGNLAAGAFSGQPVGGSVGQTTVNVTSGARSRWGAIFAGLWMLAVLVAFSGLVGKVVMPTLAAVLMFAAFRAIRPAEISSVLHAGYSSAAVMTTTFVSVLLLPVAAAVGVGLIVLQLNQEAVDLRVVRLFRTPDGHLKEEPAPRALADDDVLVLDVYGSLFYAGARTLQRHLPDPAGSHGTSVILRLRGRTTLGSTFLNVVGDYARRLAETGGSLYLSGLDPRIVSRWESHAVPETVGNVHLYEATDVLGESTREALEHAQSHRVTPLPPPADGDDPDRQ